MGPQQLAGVLSIVARQAAAARGQAVRRGRRRRRCGAAVEEQIEARVAGAVPVRPALRRRHHRPARHPHRARAVPVGRRTPRDRCDGAPDARLRRLPDVRRPADDPQAPGRQPRRDRPAGLPHLPRRWASRTVAVLLRRGRRRAVRRRGRRAPCGCPAPRRPRPTCAADLLVDAAAARPAPTPSTPATASSPRTPTSPQAVLDAGLAWVGPPPDGDRGDGVQGRGQGADGRGRRAGAAGAGRRPRCRERRRYPLLVKASAGGGGRGMRVVRDAGRAGRRGRGGRREAARAFGDGTVFSSATLEAARHIEVQVLADTPRHVVVARRAGVLGAAPPPEDRRGGAVAGGRRTPLRARLFEAAVAAARRSATSAPARSSSCSTPSRRALLPGDEHPAAGRAPGHRVRSPASTWSRCSSSSPRASRCRSTRRRRAARARDRGPALRRGPGPRLAARRPARLHRFAVPGVRRFAC